MKLYRNGQTVDVQPKYVGRYERAGWSRKPPKSSRPKKRWESKPDGPSGDVSDNEGEG